jgi:hypothetical protein
MMRGKWLWFIFAALLALSGWQYGKATSGAFGQDQAVDIVLAQHPEFPLARGKKVIEKTIGGKYPGAKVTGVLATSVEFSGEPDVYHVTLSEKWSLEIGDNEVEAFWRYKVTPQGAELVESADNTELLNIVK